MSKDKKDVSGKLPLGEILPIADLAIGAHMLWGRIKYGYENTDTYLYGDYRTYDNAYQRHRLLYELGEEFDQESGLPHVWAMFMNAYIMLCIHARDNNITNEFSVEYVVNMLNNKKEMI